MTRSTFHRRRLFPGRGLPLTRIACGFFSAYFVFVIDYLIHQVGQLPPRDLLWAFMEGSRLYQVFAGLVEVAGGLLLLTRTTAMLGALISAAAMTNVVVLDIGYDVGVKWLAGQILLMGLFVTAPYAHELADALVRHVARRPPLFQNRRADRAVRVVGVVVGILITIWAYRYAQSTVADNRAEPQTALHGIWDVEEITQRRHARSAVDHRQDALASPDPGVERRWRHVPRVDVRRADQM